MGTNGQHNGYTPKQLNDDDLCALLRQTAEMVLNVTALLAKVGANQVNIEKRLIALEQSRYDSA
jgi:hypothetical protein